MNNYRVTVNVRDNSGHESIIHQVMVRDVPADSLDHAARIVLVAAIMEFGALTEHYSSTTRGTGDRPFPISFELESISKSPGDYKEHVWST